VRAQIKAQQTEAASARASLDKQRQTIAGEFPGYADLITPATPTAEQLRRLLGPGEARFSFIRRRRRLSSGWSGPTAAAALPPAS